MSLDRLDSFYRDYYHARDADPRSFLLGDDASLPPDFEASGPSTSCSKHHFIVRLVDERQEEPLLLASADSHHRLAPHDRLTHSQSLATPPATTNSRVRGGTSGGSGCSADPRRLSLRHGCQKCVFPDRAFIDSRRGATGPRRNRWMLPFIIWKEYFLKESGCNEKNFKRAVIYSLIPHLFKILVAICCVVLGAFLFREFDSTLAETPYCEVLLFSFTTVTTIGYGNIAPVSRPGIVFCVVYIGFGVPTVFLVLSSFGQIFATCYWIIVSAIKGKAQLVTDRPETLPAWVAMVLLHGHAMIGAFLFQWLMPELDWVDSYYLSFISITTIGFGDISPKPETLSESVIMILYLSIGIIILASFIGSLTGIIRQIHYIGRHFSGAEYVEVYFGGSKFSIAELLELVSAQFNVSPQQLREVIHELDQLITLSDDPSMSETNNVPTKDELVLPIIQHQNSVTMSVASRTTNYTSRFSEAENLNLIQAIGTICHLSESGHKYFRTTPGGPLPVRKITRTATTASPLALNNFSKCRSNSLHDGLLLDAR